MGSTSGWRMAAVVAAVVLAGCADNTDSSGSTTAPGTMVLDSVGGSDTTTAPSTDATPSESGVPTSTVAPEPTGVPGLDDADPLCAAWAAYSGSLQVVGVAAAFGDVSSADIAGLELLAAVTITDSIDRIAAAWPTEVDGEFDVAVDDLLGPFDRRSEKGLAALREAGVTDDELTVIGAAWVEALRHRDPSSPYPVLPELDPALAAKVSAAALIFDAAVTPFAADPSLVVDMVETPATDAYLAEHCPELANSGVGDAV